MLTNIEEELNRDWVLNELEEHNSHIGTIDDSIADFQFKRPEWALCVSVYADAVIPLGGEDLVRFLSKSRLV